MDALSLLQLANNSGRVHSPFYSIPVIIVYDLSEPFKP